MGIFAPIAIIGIAGGGLLLMQKKKKPKYKPLPPQNHPPKPRGSDNVRALQRRLNQLLPSNYTKLVVDGIWGPKTAKAFDIVINSNINSTTKNSLLGLYKIIHGKEYQGRATSATVSIDISELQGNLTKPKRWYISAANELYDAMSPSGTDTFVIRKILREIKNKDDWKALYTAFDYRKCDRCIAFDGGDLVDWMWRELNNPLTAKTFNFWIDTLKKIGQLGQYTFLTKKLLKP